MDLAQMKAAVTMEGVLSGTAALELIAEVERLETDNRTLTEENMDMLADCTAYRGEVQRLTALCDGYRGDIDRLAGRLVEYKREAQKSYRREDDLKEARDRAELKVKELKSALTRARAEGLEEAVKVVESVRFWNLASRKEVTDAIRTEACRLAEQAEKGE